MRCKLAERRLLPNRLVRPGKKRINSEEDDCKDEGTGKLFIHRLLWFLSA